MNKQELRTRYEREYFVSADTKKGKLKQNYAIWLEEEYLKAINYTHCCKSDSEQLNVSFNVGDKVMFDNKKAVVLWTSVKYLDIEILGTNKILQGVHTSKVLPR